MPGFEEFTDPRLAAVQDSWEPARPDQAFLCDLAAAVSAQSVVDIGCGTGRLAVELAKRGYRAGRSLSTAGPRPGGPGRDGLPSSPRGPSPVGWLSKALLEAGFRVDPVDHDASDLMFVADSAPAREPVVVRIHPSASGEWSAAVLYDSSETVTVPLAGLDTVEILQRLRELGVPQELVLPELERFDQDRASARRCGNAPRPTWPTGGGATRSAASSSNVTSDADRGE